MATFSGEGGAITVQGLADGASVEFTLQAGPNPTAGFVELRSTIHREGQDPVENTVQIEVENNGRVLYRVVEPEDRWNHQATVFSETTQVYPAP